MANILWKLSVKSSLLFSTRIILISFVINNYINQKRSRKETERELCSCPKAVGSNVFRSLFPTTQVSNMIFFIVSRTLSFSLDLKHRNPTVVSVEGKYSGRESSGLSSKQFTKVMNSQIKAGIQLLCSSWSS